MLTAQHKGARNLVKIIERQSSAKSNELTYQGAARLMGRPSNHARAVAQMCDLLDAAAALAGVPLLALVKVKDATGEINKKAWKEDIARREAIIARSKKHIFRREDFLAIRDALDVLGSRGNKLSWKYVESLYGAEHYLRLTGMYTVAKDDAINDLGSDVPDKASVVSTSYERDPRVRDAVLDRAKGRCEFCGKLGFLKSKSSRYLECHHIIALANEGADRVTNVIAVCADDHREAHFGMRSSEIEREMTLKLARIIRKAP